MKYVFTLFIFCIINLITPYPTSAAQPDQDRVWGGAASEYFPKADPLEGRFTTLGELVSKLVPPLLTLAGLILFGMIIWGGFELLTAGTNAKQADAGKSRITSSIIGFIIVFAAYWIAQILQIMFGVGIVK